MINCRRHEEYSENPLAKFCGQCGRSLAETVRESPKTKLERIEFPLALGTVALGVLTLGIGSIESYLVKKEGYKPQTYSEVRSLLDQDKDGIIDLEEEKAAVIRFGRLYVPTEEERK